MKKLFCIALTLCLLTLPLCGCSGDAIPEKPMATVTTTNSETFPAPVSGTYQDQTITMQYKTVTDLNWQTDMQPTRFVNGYAVVYFYSEEAGLECGLIDTSGKLTFKSTEYISLSDVHADGRLLAKKEDDTYVCLDTSGNILGTCEDPTHNWYVSTDETRWDSAGSSIVRDGLKDAKIYDDSVLVATFGDETTSDPYGDYQQLLDTDWSPLNDTKFRRIGHFYHGLALCDVGGKLGIIDMEGNIVIEPTYSIASADASNPFSMNEDYYLFNADGKIGILKITRS